MDRELVNSTCKIIMTTTSSPKKWAWLRLGRLDHSKLEIACATVHSFHQVGAGRALDKAKRVGGGGGGGNKRARRNSTLPVFHMSS